MARWRVWLLLTHFLGSSVLFPHQLQQFLQIYAYSDFNTSKMVQNILGQRQQKTGKDFKCSKNIPQVNRFIANMWLDHDKVWKGHPWKAQSLTSKHGTRISTMWKDLIKRVQEVFVKALLVNRNLYFVYNYSLNSIPALLAWWVVNFLLCFFQLIKTSNISAPWRFKFYGPVDS